jgi:hypothetical protein
VFKYLTETEEQKLPKNKVKWVGKGPTKNFNDKKLDPNRCATIKLE